MDLRLSVCLSIGAGSCISLKLVENLKKKTKKHTKRSQRTSVLTPGISQMSIFVCEACILFQGAYLWAQVLFKAKKKWQIKANMLVKLDKLFRFSVVSSTNLKTKKKYFFFQKLVHLRMSKVLWHKYLFLLEVSYFFVFSKKYFQCIHSLNWLRICVGGLTGFDIENAFKIYDVKTYLCCSCFVMLTPAR